MILLLLLLLLFLLLLLLLGLELLQKVQLSLVTVRMEQETFLGDLLSLRLHPDCIQSRLRIQVRAVCSSDRRQEHLRGVTVQMASFALFLSSRSRSTSSGGGGGGRRKRLPTLGMMGRDRTEVMERRKEKPFLDRASAPDSSDPVQGGLVSRFTHREPLEGHRP